MMLVAVKNLFESTHFLNVFDDVGDRLIAQSDGCERCLPNIMSLVEPKREKSDLKETNKGNRIHVGNGGDLSILGDTVV
jgi:hypothetical protein